jgi:geranylgeranyl reductase family protein
MRYDVVVVGLGPAGALAAYELSRCGHRVLAIERAHLPRYKICGGALSVRASKLIPFDFTGEIEQVIHGAAFNFRGEGRFTVESSDPIAYMINREHFDFLLVSKAEKEGTCILDQVQVLDWVEGDEEITVITDSGEWPCLYLVGADGINSTIGTKRLPHNGEKRSVGFESDIPFQGPTQERLGLVQIDLGSAPYGFGWVFPKKNYRATGIAGLQGKVRDIGEMYGQFIENQGILKEASGQQVHPYQFAPFTGTTPLHQGNALWVGDAAGLIDPFSGEGLYYAIQSGRVAAEVISKTLKGKGDLSSYTAKMLAELTDEFRSARRFSRLIYRWPQTSYRFLQSHKWVVHLYFEILRGEKRYDEVWNLIKNEWFSFAWRYWFKERWSWRKRSLSSLWRRGSDLLHHKGGPLQTYPLERRGHKRF